MQKGNNGNGDGARTLAHKFDILQAHHDPHMTFISTSTYSSSHQLLFVKYLKPTYFFVNLNLRYLTNFRQPPTMWSNSERVPYLGSVVGFDTVLYRTVTVAVL